MENIQQFMSEMNMGSSGENLVLIEKKITEWAFEVQNRGHQRIYLIVNEIVLISKEY